MVIVSDGRFDFHHRQEIQDYSPAPLIIDIPDGPHYDWGHTPRNRILDSNILNGDYLIHADDDDVVVPGGLDMVRNAIRRHPGRAFMFRMSYHGDGPVVWKNPRPGNPGDYGIHNLICPNVPNKLGRFGPFHEGDFYYVTETLKHYPEGPVWRSEVYYVCNPKL